MNDEERRRRRLDRVIAEMNRLSPGMYTALQPVTDDDPDDDPDEDDDTRSTT